MAFSTGPNTHCAHSSTTHTPLCGCVMLSSLFPHCFLFTITSVKTDPCRPPGICAASVSILHRIEGEKAVQVHSRWTALLRCLALICYHCLPYWQLFKRLRLIVFDSCTHVIQTDFLEQCVVNCVCECESGVRLSDSGVNNFRQNSRFTMQCLTGYADFSSRLLKFFPTVSAGLSRGIIGINEGHRNCLFTLCWLCGCVRVTSVGWSDSCLAFQGAIGPDGPTGEMGLEGKKVRNRLQLGTFIGISLCKHKGSHIQKQVISTDLHVSV